MGRVIPILLHPTFRSASWWFLFKLFYSNLITEKYFGFSPRLKKITEMWEFFPTYYFCRHNSTIKSIYDLKTLFGKFENKIITEKLLGFWKSWITRLKKRYNNEITNVMSTYLLKEINLTLYILELLIKSDIVSFGIHHI